MLLVADKGKSVPVESNELKAARNANIVFLLFAEFEKFVIAVIDYYFVRCYINEISFAFALVHCRSDFIRIAVELSF